MTSVNLCTIKGSLPQNGSDAWKTMLKKSAFILKEAAYKDFVLDESVKSTGTLLLMQPLYVAHT